MNDVFSLKNIRLWWPRLNTGIEIEHMESKGIVRHTDGAFNATFNFDPTLAEFQNVQTNHRMPVNTAKLFNLSTNEVVNYTSFSILDDGRVQVNTLYQGGYSVRFYYLYELGFRGETYDLDVDTD